jgi:hypothetical protein
MFRRLLKAVEKGAKGMKKLLMVLGLVSLMVMAVPAFPQSLRFDFDGDGQGDSDWGMVPGETVQVDVWLDDYQSDNDVSSIIYGFLWDPASVTVTNAWPFDTDNGGPWSTTTSYAHLEYNGGYWYKVGGPNIVTGIPVDTKIKLHTIELQYLGGESQIETYKVLPDFEGVYVLPAGGTELFNLTHGSALIHPDCDITIDPGATTLFTGESIPFSASVSGDFCQNPCYTWEISSMGCTGSTIVGDGTGNSTGIYTAGEPLSGNTCNDTVQVTDDCNNGIADTAVVNVKVVIECVDAEDCDDGEFCNGDETCVGGSCQAGTDPCVPPDVCNEVSDVCRPPTTTTTTGGGGGGGGTATTTTIPIGGTCLNDKNCNDAIYCNGEEVCARSDVSDSESSFYTWSSSFAAATGTQMGICQKGDDPCPDDGEFCNGIESCDEDNAACLSTGDPCEGEDLVCDEENDVCILAQCIEDAACDDELFCNGEETCVGGFCQAGEVSCLPPLQCDEENDRCLNEPDTLSFRLIPQSAFRSHLIPLSFIMLIRSTDDVTTFDQETTAVSFSGDAIVSPPLTLVLTKKLIFVFSILTSADFGTSGKTEVAVSVTTPERKGRAFLTVMTPPLF